MNGLSVKLNDFVEFTPLPRPYDYGASSMIRGSLDRLPNSEPFFYFANFMEAHSPYSPSVKYNSAMYDVPRGWSENAKEWEINENPEEYTEILEGRRSVYGASIDYLDRTVSSFVKKLLERTDGETAVFITADHGENLAFEKEEFLWGHQGSLSHPLLHVPFVAVNLPQKYVDCLEKEPFSHLDLGTLLTAVALDEPLDIPSREYVPAERVGYGPSTEPDNFEYWDRAIRCVYDGTDRYEWDSLGNQFKYEIAGDSAEKMVLDDTEIPDPLLRSFDESIEEYKRTVSGEERIDLDGQTKEALSDLGYL
jgi:arylsulfatase A-like enzyme